MNISSLIKIFGIAAAGFVPQAQANPFGISFVKVDPPKDKKEEAICFRLKLSQTDVFSEHNFTDITFRHNTTVFLQKNMVIGDEEESLKKPFKNFNAEKDPFEKEVFGLLQSITDEKVRALLLAQIKAVSTL